MSETAKAVVRRYLAEYVSAGDPRALADLVSEDLVFASPYTPEPVHGREGFAAMITGLRSAFPDLVIQEHDVVAEGDLVATRWTASGTHRGADFSGAPASGRGFAISGMSFYRVADGRIVEGWVNDDTIGMLTQLGLLPSADHVG